MQMTKYDLIIRGEQKRCQITQIHQKNNDKMKLIFFTENLK